MVEKRIDVLLNYASTGGAALEDGVKKIKRLQTSAATLAKTLAGLEQKPEVFLVASAIGFYGNRGDEELLESSDPGEGYLSETCLAWEASAQTAKDAGIRTIHARTAGIVLDATGGGFGKMLLPAKLGAGGPIGRGRQWLSWISMDDEVYAMHHLLMTESCEGAYNLVSPGIVQQKKFAKVLGKNNPADLYTKYLDLNTSETHVKTLNHQFVQQIPLQLTARPLPIFAANM